jgi:hypothetical protein
MTLRHVLELLQQNAELAQQVLFLKFKVDRLRQLSNAVLYHQDAWRMLGRRRPSARMRVALNYTNGFAPRVRSPRHCVMCGSCTGSRRPRMPSRHS